MSDTVDLDALEKLIAAMTAAEPCGPMTTFPFNRDGTPGKLAHVAIVCNRDRFDDVVRWLSAMVKQTPALLELGKAAAEWKASMEIDDYRRQDAACTALAKAAAKVKR